MSTMGTCVEAKLDWERFGEFVAKQRKRLGMTQLQLAIEMGKKQPDISCIERGETESTVETIARLAEALQTEPLILFAAILKK